MAEREITDVETLIERLGGLAESARFFGETMNTVWNWKARGQMPTRLYFRHEAALAARGMKAAKSIWGFAPDEAAA